MSVTADVLGLIGSGASRVELTTTGRVIINQQFSDNSGANLSVRDHFSIGNPDLGSNKLILAANTGATTYVNTLPAKTGTFAMTNDTVSMTQFTGLTKGGVVYASLATSMSTTAAGVVGQVLVSGGANAPTRDQE